MVVSVAPGADIDVDAALRDVQPQISSSVRVEHADYAPERLESAALEIVKSGKFSGAEVSWAAPKPDGSGIDVGLVSAPKAPRAMPAMTFDGIPVSTEVTGHAVVASRDYDFPPFIAGADMNRDAAQANYISICTTAFAVVKLGVESLLTADHCARGGGGATWRTSNQYSNALEIGNHPGILPAPELIPDITTITGKDYAPYMYYGPNTSNSFVAVSGSWNPILDTYVHYSGARSGSIYNNRVTHTGVAVRYNDSGTYAGLVRTVQIYDIPAVGNGDSGGPAFALTSSGQVLAAGIISGMDAPTTNCSGDPGVDGRVCSKTVFLQPVVPYLNANGYSILTP